MILLSCDILVGVILSAALGYLWGGDVSLSQQQAILTNLATVGGVVFGILGAWLAIVYPRIYEQSLDQNTPVDIAAERVEFFVRCLRPMIISCVIFVFSLLSLPVAACFAETDHSALESLCARRVFFSTCVLLTTAQVIAMIQSLLPVLDSKDSLRETISRRQSGERARGASSPVVISPMQRGP